jgi:hypothetical protein
MKWLGFSHEFTVELAFVIPMYIPLNSGSRYAYLIRGCSEKNC